MHLGGLLLQVWRTTHFAGKRQTGVMMKWCCAFPTEHPFIWGLVKTVVLAVPAFVCSLLSFDFGANTPPLQQELLSYFTNHQGLFIFCLVFPIPGAIVFDVLEHVCRYFYAAREPDKDEYSIIVQGLAQVVGAKRSGLHDLARRAREEHSKFMPADVLQVLARPKDQIREITEQLYYCLREISGAHDLKLMILRIEAGGLPAVLRGVIMPKNANVCAALLSEDNARKTFFWAAVEAQEAIVISDIEMHLQKPKKTG